MSRESAFALAATAPTVAIEKTEPLVGNPDPTAAQSTSGEIKLASDTETLAPEVPTDLPSRAFSQLAKKEAELVRQRQEFVLEKEKAAAVLKKAEDYEALKKTDPIAALKLIGFSETDVINYMADQQQPELTSEQKAIQAAEAAAEAKIKTYEENEAKKHAERQKQADEAQIKNFKDNITKTVSDNAEKFKLCKFAGTSAENAIYEYVLKVVTETNGKEVPTPEEAASKVEEFYVEQFQAVKKLLEGEPTAPEAPKEEAKPTPQAIPRAPSRMLTNNATTTAAALKTINETRQQKMDRWSARLRNGG